MIVVDASTIVAYLIGAPSARLIAERLFAPGRSLHAPHLLDVEVLHAARRLAAKGDITEARGQSMLDDLADLPLIRYPHTLLTRRIWELRHNLTAYDAAYVALAEVLSAPLLTADRRVPATTGHRALIELIPKDN